MDHSKQYNPFLSVDTNRQDDLVTQNNAALQTNMD